MHSWMIVLKLWTWIFALTIKAKFHSPQKMTALKISFMMAILQSNTALTAENEESLNKRGWEWFNGKWELNGSTESNEIMNIEDRKHEESNEVKEEDAFNTAQMKQKNQMPIYQVMILNRVMNLNWGLVNKFLRNFMVVIHITSFPMIQILVNYQIRKRKDPWRILQRSAKKEMTAWSILFPTVMKRCWIQRFFIVVWRKWDQKEKAFKAVMILMFFII